MKHFDLNLIKIKILFIEIYLVLMSFIILSIFFYYRFIIKRFDYSLEILKNNITFNYLILCFSLMLLHLFILCGIVFQLLNKNKKIDYKIFFYLEKIIEILLYKPVDYAITKISPYIPYSGTLIINYCYFFRKNVFRLFLAKTLCFMLYFSTKIFMALLFLIEVVYYNQVKYFFMLILIFILPYIYLLFLNLSEKFYTNNIQEVEESIIVTAEGIPNSNGVYNNYKIQLKENSGYTEKELPELIDAWDVLFYILNLNAIIRNFMSKVGPYVTLLTSSCYCLAFNYQLYYFLIL